ncbi:MAG: RNA-binding protein [Planctomycetota bacterium]|nr:MAG: RNA-binding protein [Planctomycetota bacterium]
MNIYVGNLSGDVSEDDLRGAFEAFGEVISVNIVKDRVSGESRGFGFVQMPSRNEALAAISGMNDKDLKGRTVNVAEARPRAQDRRGGGGRRGGFGGGRRGGRGGFGGGSRGGERGGFSGGRGKRRY